MEMDRQFPVTLDDVQLRRDLIAQNWTDRAIARQVALGFLAKIRYGAYVDASLVEGLDDVQRLRVRSRAVLRTAHATAVLSHQSALAEYDIATWGLRLDEVHLTRTDGKSGRREAGVAHHCGHLDASEVERRHGVPVVSAARAVIEVILTHGREEGLVALCAVLNAGLATLEEIRQVAARTDQWPNSLHARLVLDRADERISSVGEGRSWHLFHEQRIPRPEPQVKVFDELGSLLGIVDFLWPEHGVFLEFDGRIKYERHRRPGESLEDYVMREKRREEAICAATGWVCLRITWADLGRPVATARRIKTLLESRTTPAA
jgi:hypothetical protein